MALEPFGPNKSEDALFLRRQIADQRELWKEYFAIDGISEELRQDLSGCIELANKLLWLGWGLK